MTKKILKIFWSSKWSEKLNKVRLFAYKKYKILKKLFIAVTTSADFFSRVTLHILLLFRQVLLIALDAWVEQDKLEYHWKGNKQTKFVLVLETHNDMKYAKHQNGCIHETLSHGHFFSAGTTMCPAVSSYTTKSDAVSCELIFKQIYWLIWNDHSALLTVDDLSFIIQHIQTKV